LFAVKETWREGRRKGPTDSFNVIILQTISHTHFVGREGFGQRREEMTYIMVTVSAL